MTNKVLSTPLSSRPTPVGRHPLDDIKWMLWLYIVLLVFEGALRKWFLPFLAQPLLIVRDPVALLILLQAANRRVDILNPYTLVIFFTTLLSFLMTFYSGHQNLYVAVYGLRITLLHFPLIFVFGNVFDRSDVEKVGKFLLYLVIPMTVLIALQFYSPQSAWVNRSVGGEEGGGFDGAMGYFRPPATFSFTNGTTLFYSLAVVFVLYFWQRAISKSFFPVLVLATAGVLIAIPLSMSRGYLFQLIISVVFFVMGSLVGGGKAVGRLGLAAVIVPLLLMVLSGFEFVQNGIEAFSARFTNASTSEGGLQGTLGDRFLGSMVGAIGDSDSLPFWGLGLGMGTNVGAKILTGTTEVFLISETEWGRIIGEMGALLGITTILARVILAIHFSIKSVYYVFNRRPLPWLLTSFGIIQIVNANWSQPTAQGFAMVTAGLLLASFSEPKNPATYAG